MAATKKIKAEEWEAEADKGKRTFRRKSESSFFGVFFIIKDKGGSIMKASEILWHNEESVRFMQSLSQLTEEEWRRPLGQGKWTIAEVAGHLAPWDQFILEHRLPYFFRDAPLPEGPDAEVLNARSAKESRLRSLEETIEEFVFVRRQLIGALRDLQAGDWSREFQIGDTRMTLVHYFEEMIEHDEHHFRQIRHALDI